MGIMSSSLSEAFVASATLGAALMGNITAGVLDHYTLDKAATLSEPFIAAVMKPETHNLDRASVLRANVVAAQPIHLWDSWVNRKKVNEVLYAQSYIRSYIGMMPDRYVADCTVAAMDANTQAIDMNKATQCFSEISAQRREDKQWSNSIIGVAAFCSALFAAGWFSPQLKARMNANYPSQGPR